MARTYIWRKSSYSGGGDGNNCVEVAALSAHVAVRDSKAPDRGVLAVSGAVFGAFVEGLKARSMPTR
ncbi:DUF397 domain-containing protein [Streptomyces sp. NPDC046939]|uniref:DUF397 domain-containing protein n=1 Tax=Streptomyces sp. NPDC046939 TaxID=3155376 RepID=UPI0033E7271C